MTIYKNKSYELHLWQDAALMIMPRGSKCRGICLVNHPSVLSPNGEHAAWLTRDNDAQLSILTLLKGIWPELMLRDEIALRQAMAQETFYLLNTDHPLGRQVAEEWVSTVTSVRGEGLSEAPLAHFEWLKQKGFSREGRPLKRINVLGLGDVGSTMALALQAYGKGIVDEIGIFDLESHRIERWEMELNQIAEPLDSQLPKVVPLTEDMLFDCDLFAFTASVGVPPLSVTQGDVRVVQYQGNSQIVELYVNKAMKAGFTGIFAIVSDPVDLLCRHALEVSLKIGQQDPGLKALLPEQIRGYGLGVMNGRAAYFSEKRQTSYDQGRVFGPHGEGLVVANDWRPGYFDELLSENLTYDTTTANLQMRALGYKPYVAPAVASGAISLLRTLSGEWHYSCISFNGLYYGCLNKRYQYFDEHEQLNMDPLLFEKVDTSFKEMEVQWQRL